MRAVVSLSSAFADGSVASFYRMFQFLFRCDREIVLCRGRSRQGRHLRGPRSLTNSKNDASGRTESLKAMRTATFGGKLLCEPRSPPVFVIPISGVLNVAEKLPGTPARSATFHVRPRGSGSRGLKTPLRVLNQLKRAVTETKAVNFFSHELYLKGTFVLCRQPLECISVGLFRPLPKGHLPPCG